MYILCVLYGIGVIILKKALSPIWQKLYCQIDNIDILKFCRTFCRSKI